MRQYGIYSYYPLVFDILTFVMMSCHGVTKINNYNFLSYLYQINTSENDVPFQRNSNKHSCKKLYGQE